MTDTDAPAGATGGNTGAPDAAAVEAALPPRLRVHALAKTLSVTSKDVISTLADLGVTVRSPQSGIDRETAVRAVQVLLPDPRAESASTEAAPESAEERAPGVPLAPVFNPPEPVSRPALIPEQVTGADGEAGQESGAEGDEAESGRRRRRRGRRGRGRGKGDTDTEESAEPSGTSDGPETAGPPEHAMTGDGDEHTAEQGEAARRRRRRRRRKGTEDNRTGEDDPPNTVTHVREAKERSAEEEEEVQTVRGSTRLESKRQRRREGRESGRRRAPILSESEFLTRREAVDRTMVVREHGDRTQIGVLEDGILVEHFVTTSGSGSLVGNVYLGRVQNVLSSMEAAFVDIGRGRNAVLYAGEVDWDAAGLAGKSRRIEQALTSGDSVLVQVTKDPVGHKGARLTTQISLPGRFLVYVPGGHSTGISRKLPDTERKRLKDVLKRIVPDEAGVIIRTASEGTTEQELSRDVRRLRAQWEVIQNKTNGSTKAPELVYEEPDLLVRVVRDLFTEDFGELVVQGEDAWDTVDGYVQHVAPDLMPRVRRATSDDVFAEFRVDEQITKALDRKVWLPSGGYLIIDRTEAMTVIDVNTGKFTGSGGNLEETVTKNNLEAAEEAVRQLRLRDIGGIIVIDFIDMVLETNRDLVLRRLTECLGRDRTRHQVAEVTSLGLVQMTRKRVGSGLLEAFSTPCEHCKGRGVQLSTEPVDNHGNGRGGSSEGGRRSQARGRGSGSRQARAAEHAEASQPARDTVTQPAAGSPAIGAEPEHAAQVQPETSRRSGRRRRSASRPAGPPPATGTEAADRDRDGDAVSRAG